MEYLAGRWRRRWLVIDVIEVFTFAPYLGRSGFVEGGPHPGWVPQIQLQHVTAIQSRILSRHAVGATVIALLLVADMTSRGEWQHASLQTMGIASIFE